MISMTAVWEETSAFLKREQALLVPLWLGTFVVGDAGITLASNVMRAAGTQGSTPAVIALFVCALIAMAGQLAATAMVLRSGISLGEAIRLGLSRMPKLISIGLISVFLGLLVIMPLLLMLAKSGVDFSSARPNIPQWASFYMLVVAAVALWLGARLVTLTPMIIDSDAPILSAIRDGFAQTKGCSARIIGVFLLYFVVALVVGAVARFLVAGPIIYLGGLIGLSSIAVVLAAVATGLFGGGLTMIAALFMAHLYKALKGSA
jgi:hypothetical protein